MNAINFDVLKQYESFNNITEMNESIYNYIDHLKHNVPQSVIDVLFCLGKASLRCIGLSFMKQATIAKETGYSRKTVNKAIKKLESIGVIDSVRTQTMSGRPSVKVVRILPFSLERLQQVVTSDKVQEANIDNELSLIDEFEPFEKESLPNNLREDKEGMTSRDNKVITSNDKESESDKIDCSFIPKDIVPEDFINTAKPFFKAKRIFRLWGIVKNAMKQMKVYLSQEVIEAIIESFKTSIFMEKLGRIKKSFDGYFFGVLITKFAPISRKVVATTHKGNILFYDWLNDANNDTEGDNTIYYDWINE
ncbi:helix-turn-helix transcriptional regulator [Piscibacillus sp. B03]|uniref:helix-turn-helix transcriptional regulator n=1 Tax=Piscibacillus sp. B03 TaxID=3457430 RepID=UPI003FCD6F8A